MLSTLNKLFIKMLGGSRNDRLVRARMSVVRERINVVGKQLEEEYLALVRKAASTSGVDPDELVQMAKELKVAPIAAKEWLSGKTKEFRQRLDAGESLDDILPEAFAVVRMASWLARDHRQFDVQLVAGQVLHEGAIAEEATGEGKTIACYPAIYMAVLAGMKVHVVTVNDYLVKRDRDFAWPIFDLLDMRVGAIQQPMDNAERQRQYACDVIYGTNSEFGFDYLRDNMKLSVAEQVQHVRDYAIIDEVDSILIDEARTPLIISGPAFGDVRRYAKADAVAREIIKRHRPYQQAENRVENLKRTLKALEGELSKAKGEDKKKSIASRLEKTQEELARAEQELSRLTKYYEVELDKKTAYLTHEGITAAQEIAGIGSFYVGSNMEWPHLLEQALRAHVVYQRDKDYVVRDGEVVIVDEFTGRLMEGREWSDGLHQAVEAKERVPIKEENQTLATITLQNFFKLYKKLAGMTGTAMTEAEEFKKIYNLEVIAVPTHRPVNRVDYNDRVYGTVEEKYDAIVEEINAYSKAGRPVLVGTTSIEKSDKLSEMLTRRYGVAHEVLNARPENAAREAEIVARAGQQSPIRPGSKQMVGNVTIATNMAGRGTDIKLGAGVVNPVCKVPSLEKLAELGVEPQELFPPGSTKCCINCPEYDPATNCAHCFKPKLDPSFPRRGRSSCREDVPCGLHIVGTERHEARRIDNQLRGRAGRQGDPGSSRFFVSLRDDLMAIFAGEWTLKVLSWLGLQKGQAIEDKRITKGIERAQKKVEQRNFDIRKNLLEYDEVMDRQRRYFYSRRQQILIGKDVEKIVREMIRETIDDAVSDYLSGDYSQRCIARWVHQNLELNIEASQIHADSIEDFPALEAELREKALDEAANVINVTIGEYADPSIDRKNWDLRGLSSWAMSRFRVNISQNQLRKMDIPEMEQAILQGATEYINSIDMTPLQRFLEKGYPEKALAEMLRNKFGIEIVPEELGSGDVQAVKERLYQAVEQVYLRREIEYPCDYAIDITIGQAGVDNVYALTALCDWANRKFATDWTPEELTGKTVEQIRSDLISLAEQFLAGGRLEQEVDSFISGLISRSPGGQIDSDRFPAIIDWCARRFDTAVSEDELREVLESCPSPADVSAAIRQFLINVGRGYLRRELTELEKFVLLQIHDSSWKDHLLAMDHLKGSVGLRSFAEQDPRLVYKREGFKLFEEMLASIREKVTDIIFKARLGVEAEMESVYQVSQLVHEQLSGYDHLAQEMAAQQAAAAQASKVQTIRRQGKKIGRNDPCPCGSGKKYKNCCGRNL
ncbi:MAG: preprotein translocase subunit SecA [Planctomycetes bacterium]|nr:preprotein translocase subunit SecA [Planctomycetota bacterium]